MRTGVTTKLLCVAFGLMATASALLAQPDPEFIEPGWFSSDGALSAEEMSGSPVESLGEDWAARPPGGSPTSVAEASTAEIQALARGLGNDPKRIFDWVHDHIRHVLYFGSKKGAQMTLLERSGNDFDQCALLVALLRAAGHSPGYVFSWMVMPVDSSDHRDLRHWLQLSLTNSSWANTQSYFEALLKVRGYPRVINVDNNNLLALPRVWVVLPFATNGYYYLDPAFKVHESIVASNAFDLTNAMKLSTNGLLTAAGGTVDANNYYVRNVNEAGLAGKLTEYTTNLLGALRTNHPNASVEEILGGWRVVSSETDALRTNSLFGFVDPVPWQNLPTEWMSTLTIAFAGTNKLWYMPELQGKRLALVFDGNGTGNVWLDDAQALSRATTGTATNVDVTLTINHPHGIWTNDTVLDTGQNDQAVTVGYLRTNSWYALLYGFETGPEALRRRQEKLDGYLDHLADTSREVVTETLNVMGADWMLQTELADRVLNAQLNCLGQYHHRVGRMAQETGRGYYVDMFAQVSATAASGGDQAQAIAQRAKYVQVSAFMLSALEHAVIEQLQSSNLVAASTVKMIQLANAGGQRIYLAGTNNWSAIKNGLSGYDQNYLQNLVINSNNTLLLPEDGGTPVAGSGSWRGYGIVNRSPVSAGGAVSFTMLIAGNYNGGFSAYSWATINPSYIYESSWLQPTKFELYSPYVGSSFAGDPVNMADGAFTVNETDLKIGQAEPRGITFARHYTPTRRHHNLAGLGQGWTHNYHFKAAEVSAPQAGLGLTTPQQMAPMIVATRAAAELYRTQPDPKTWAVTALIAKWGVDQLISNAVSVTLGSDTAQFIKQPNGVFTPPASSKLSLTKTASAYTLQERNGNTFKFNPVGLLTNIVDQYNQSLKLKYNGDNLLTNAADWKGRSLAFTYSGTPARLASVTSSAGGSVAYAYATNGGQLDLVSVTDPENKTRTFVYDASHQMLATRDALGQVVSSNVYDGFGRVIEQYSQGDTNQTWRFYWSDFVNTEQDPAGGQRRYTYDDQHRLIAQLDALGHVARKFYDGQDHVIQTVSSLNETNRVEYDGRHNPVRSVDALGFTNQYAYDAQDHLTSTVDARGDTNRFGYNAKHQLTAATNGAGNWVTLAYNQTDGTLTNRVDAHSTNSFSYDALGQLSRLTYPAGLGSEGFLNSTNGDVLSRTNARGFVTSFQYNQRRELTNSIAPTNVTAKVVYDAVGNVLATTDARGFNTSNTWSATRKLLATRWPATPQGVPLTTNLYNTRDWLAQTVDPLQAVHTSYYDAAGRVTRVTDPLDRKTDFAYDAAGRPTAVTNAAGEITRQEWNARGEKTNAVDGANRSVQAGFDPVGNQIALTNRNGKRWQFQFDAANRLTNTLTPLGRETRVTYDARGLVSTLREPSTQWTTNFYDAKGRLTNSTDAVGVRGFYYDGNDNLTIVTNVGQASRLSQSFDAYDRMTAHTNADGYVIQYRYDANGNLTNLIYPGNRTVVYAYDALNRLTNVTDWANGQTRIEYDLASRVKKITRPNGTTREINYDSAGQTTNIMEKMAIGVPIAFFKLSWSDAGRVDWEFAAPLPHAYTPPTRTMYFDADNRLTNCNSQFVTNDADGNLTWGPLTNDTSVGYSYDARNRLTNAAGISYGYDPAGNRTAVTNGANVTRFVINPNPSLSQVLMRVRSGVTNYYVHGLGLLYEITETATSTNTLTYHYDYRGSTVALTDTNGIPKDRIEYSSYGTTTYRSGTNDTPFLFNGRYGVQTDPNGLLYMRARCYNPYLCRFLNADPSGFAGGLNFYAYADGNPVSMMDPFGLGAGEVGGRSWIQQWGDQWSNAWEDMEWNDRQAQVWAQQHPTPGYQMAADFLPFAGNLVRGSVAAWNGDVSKTEQVSGALYTEGFLSLLTMGTAKLLGPAATPAAENTVTRYVGATEARIAQETGFIPNVDRFGQPKVVYVTPEAPVASASQAEGIYQIGRMNPMGATAPPTHVIVGNPQGISFINGGNVAGSTQLGTELMTGQRIPVISVRPIRGN